MKNRIYNIVLKTLSIVLILTVTASCTKFLEERPSKSTSLVVTTADQLDALLSSYGSYYSEGNRTLIHSTDDYALTKEMFDVRPNLYSMSQVEFALWDTEYLPDDGREGFWSGEFGKIFRANMVLSSLSKVTGSEQQKEGLKAEAHLLRAYSYWNLANTYCLPYTEANKNEIGLPIKTSTSFEEPLERQSLEKVYELIEADLTEALKTNVPLMRDGVARHWRGNKAAVHGFAARYYLHRNNYTEALKHADLALSQHNVLVDYNTEMKYGRDQTVKINTGTPSAADVVLKYPYGHDNQTDMTDMLGWKEFLYFRMLNHESWFYIPSQELIDLYDHMNDLRYEYHFVEGYSYDRGMTNPAFDWPGYIFFFKDRIPSGPTVAEMYLIKAESMARNGDVPGAMTTINKLRASRMKPGAWVNLTASGKDEAIKKILEERRREVPFTQRWYDIRRFNNNEDPNDDVELSRSFYPYSISSVQASEPVKTYTLTKNSRRFAAPLPRTEMISSQGKIIQNTY